MNSLTKSAPVGDAGRRTFLKNLAVIGGGLAFAPRSLLAEPINKYPCRHANRFHWFAEGTGTFQTVLGYDWPELFNQFPPEMKFRVRYRFPIGGRDVLGLQVFVAPDPEDALFGLAVPEEMLISDGTIWLQEIAINGPVDHPSYGSKPTFAILGRIITNRIPSPFGEIVGRTFTLASAFDGEGDDVMFYLLGGTAAGSHATFVHEANGSFRYRGQ